MSFGASEAYRPECPKRRPQRSPDGANGAKSPKEAQKGQNGANSAKYLKKG